MRSLYESILDTDTQAQSDTLDKPLQELVEFLMLDKPQSGKYKYMVTFGKLYVGGSKNYHVESFQFDITAGKVFNKRTKDSVIDVNLLKLVYFNNVQIRIDTAELPEFLANCNNCTITYKGFRKEAYQGLDKLLSKTKGNTINIWSTEPEGDHMLLYDYSCVSGLNLGNCRVVLFNSADLSTIKNMTARELIIQRGGKFEKDGPLFEAEREMSDYVTQKIDEFLARNKIYSFGMVDSFVQFIDWFVKKGNDYTIVFLESDKKRIPKIK